MSFCKFCGKQLEEGQKCDCPEAIAEAAKEEAEQAVSSAQEEAKKAIEEAKIQAEAVKEEAAKASQAAQKAVEASIEADKKDAHAQAGSFMDKYATAEYVCKAVCAASIFGFVIWLIRIPLTIINSIILIPFKLSILSTILFRALIPILGLAGMAISIAALVGTIYRMQKYNENNTTVNLAIIISTISLFGCAGFAFRSSYRQLVLASAAMGLDIIAKVLIRKVGLNGELNIKEDIETYKKFFSGKKA